MKFIIESQQTSPWTKVQMELQDEGELLYDCIPELQNKRTAPQAVKKEPVEVWHLGHKSERAGYILCQALGLINNPYKMLNCLSQVELDTKTLMGWPISSFHASTSMVQRSASHLLLTLSELSTLKEEETFLVKNLRSVFFIS